VRIFGYDVYVSPPKGTMVGPHRQLRIYVGYDSPSIIKYLELRIRNLFTVWLFDCHFDEYVFPTLGGERKQLEKGIGVNELSLSHLDPRTKECELEVQRIIHFQN